MAKGCERCGSTDVDLFEIEHGLKHVICLQCDKEWVE